MDESLGEIASTLHAALQQQPQSVWVPLFQDPMLRQHLTRYVERSQLVHENYQAVR